jgi:Flp pilus assembly protein TadG
MIHPLLSRRCPRVGRRLGSEDGYVTIWMLLWLPVLLLGLAMIVDYGASIQTRALASDVALGAARAGAVEVVSVAKAGPEVDGPAAVTNAAAYVTQAQHQAPAGVTLTATYQTTADTVTVTVTATYDPRFLRTMTATFTRTEQAQIQAGR